MFTLTYWVYCPYKDFAFKNIPHVIIFNFGTVVHTNINKAFGTSWNNKYKLVHF